MFSLAETNPTVTLILIVASTVLLCSLLFGLLFARSRIRQLREQIMETRLALQETENHRDELEIANSKHRHRNIRLISLIRSERVHAREKLDLLEQAREELRLQFNELAQQIFDDRNEKFTHQSKQNIESILKPFQNQLDTFKKEINDLHLHDTKERVSLQREIIHLKELNQQINQEAINLTKALKGNTKVQGNWGEVILERVLEQSGLRRGLEYEVQKSLRDYDNKMFRPDVIFHLPERKDIILDSKVSLVSWEKYSSAETDEKRDQHLDELIKSIRNHIAELGNKKYWDLQGIHSLDFVLLFMPIESAFLAALHHDTSLLDFASSHKVVVVTPTTLLVTLRTIQNIWKYEHQSQNSLEISRRAGLMYDKFRNFVEDLEKIGRALETCQQSYESAVNKLSRGKGNLLGQATALTELGVQVKKELTPAPEKEDFSVDA